MGGVLADVTSIFGARGISIEAIIQKEPDEDDARDQATPPVVPIIILTGRVREGLVHDAISEVEKLDSMTESVVSLRVETLS